MQSQKPLLSKSEKEEKISLDEFFLTEKEFPGLYFHALKRHAKKAATMSEDEAKLHAPVLQLSSKGLMLISHLYAEKDHSVKQPLVADTVDGLKHLTKQLNEAAVGTKVTVIFMASRGLDEMLWRHLPPIHKTVFEIERTQQSLRVINIDSVPYNPSWIYSSIIEKSAQHVYFKVRDISKPTKNIEDSSEEKESDEEDILFTRQKDGYQCGIFALKDARRVNKTPHFFDKIQESTESIDKSSAIQNYDLPIEYMKGVQDKEYKAFLLKDHAKDVVNAKGATLEEVYKKYESRGYINYFSQKYKDWVTKYYEINKNNPDKIKNDIAQYDASKMTVDKLNEIYGPKKSNAKKRKNDSEHEIPETVKKPMLSKPF